MYFSIAGNYLRPSNNYRPLNININAVVLIEITYVLRFTKMVKYLPEFEYFSAFLKNKNIIFKIRRLKVTDYAALNNG